jgi:PAS domain S-box-containing protein
MIGYDVAGSLPDGIAVLPPQNEPWTPYRWRSIMPLLDLTNLTERDRNAVTRARLAALVSSSADAILVTTLEGIITDWNPAAERLFGYPAEEAIGQSVALLTPPERTHEIALLLAQLLQGESVERFETVLRTIDGRLVDVSLTLSPIHTGTGQIIAVSSIARDITERRRAEAALRESAARFRAAFENAAVGMLLTAPDERTLQVNQALCDLLGYSEPELLSMSFAAITHPADIYLTHADLVPMLTEESDTYEVEKRYLRKDGQIIWGHLSGSLIRDAMGAPRYYLSLIQDITERKAADAELAATHQRTRDVLERITDAFYALDREWRFTYINPTAERLVGRTRAELLGQNIWEEFPPAVETPIYEAYHEAVTESVTTTIEFFYPPFAAWFEVRIYPSPNGVSVFFTEITARKRLEQELKAALTAANAATHEGSREVREGTTDGPGAKRERGRVRREDAEEGGITLLDSLPVWLRAKVRDAEAVPGEDHIVWPLIVEELQRLLPVAVARLVDDAIGCNGAAIEPGALRGVLSRQLLSWDELTTMPRAALVALATLRFREQELSDSSNACDRADG